MDQYQWMAKRIFKFRGSMMSTSTVKPQEFAQKTATERARAAAMVRRDEQKSGKRNRIDPATCEIDYTSDEIEFMMALQRYKEQRRRPFPTTKEILEVVRSLGYHKDAECVLQIA